MGVAGILFELHPPNLVRFHFFHSCKNAEILVVISVVVSDLPKISVSVLSISGGVLGRAELEIGIDMGASSLLIFSVY